VSSMKLNYLALLSKRGPNYMLFSKTGNNSDETYKCFNYILDKKVGLNYTVKD